MEGKRTTLMHVPMGTLLRVSDHRTAEPIDTRCILEGCSIVIPVPPEG